uniref:DNA-directed RNA polymerase n=1 Tax=Heterorhabditis bacteriophora TaxID=37862 RepID=A0A1I7WAE1_HETBA
MYVDYFYKSNTRVFFLLKFFLYLYYIKALNRLLNKFTKLFHDIQQIHLSGYNIILDFRFKAHLYDKLFINKLKIMSFFLKLLIFIKISLAYRLLKTIENNGLFANHKPLTNYDIIYLVNKFKMKIFRGVFIRDTIPDKINNNELKIMELIGFVIIKINFIYDNLSYKYIRWLQKF